MSNFIDEHVFAKLQRLRIEPSDLCGDAEFIRRASLDITGTLPTSDQVKAFIVENKTTPGFKVEQIQNKIALKVVQNGLITMEKVRVLKYDRTPGG